MYQSCKFFILALSSGYTVKHISGLEPEASYETGRYIHVIFSREEIFTSDKAETVLHDFKNSVGFKIFALRLLKILPFRYASCPYMLKLLLFSSLNVLFGLCGR